MFSHLEPTCFTYPGKLTPYLLSIDKTKPMAIKETKPLLPFRVLWRRTSPPLTAEPQHLNTEPPLWFPPTSLGLPQPYSSFGWWPRGAVSGRSLAGRGFPCHAILSKHFPEKLVGCDCGPVSTCSTLASLNLPEPAESSLSSCIWAILFRSNVFPKSYQWNKLRCVFILIYRQRSQEEGDQASEKKYEA